MNDFNYLKTKTDGEQRLWVTLLPHETKQHSPDTHVFDELSALFNDISQNTVLQGLIIQGDETFIQTRPGSHPQYFNQSDNSKQTFELISKGQIALKQLETLDIPSVVLIDHLNPGYSMELALAADYCIASDNPTSSLNFSEISLGLHPVMGGTQRIVRRLGASPALNCLLKNDVISPQGAAKIGLIDDCVPSPQLQQTACHFLDRKPRKQQADLIHQLANLSLLRPLISIELTKKAKQASNPEHYPAPFALIALWKKHGHSTDENAQKDYADSLINLGKTSQAIGLSRISRLKQRLYQASKSTLHTNVEHAHLIGSDMTTGDVATYLVLQGLTVTIQDKQPEAVRQTIEHVRQNLSTQLGYRDNQITKIMADLSADQENTGVETADLILVVKSLSLADTQEAVAELEERARPDAILATHSSILTLGKIAAVLLKPQRLINIHFCYPAYKTELTEVSFTNVTDPKLLEQSLQVLHNLKKLPLLMKNSPGLLVDRILMQYVLQGIRLYQQGVPHRIIDQAGRDAGMPSGPLELADKIGLDYCLRVAEALEKAYKIDIPYHLIDMVKTGKFGIKSGAGFYRYRNGNRLKPERVPWEGSKQALQQKLTSQISEEASVCLEDGLIEDPDLIDAGITFGTGFAPYLGGPLYDERNRAKQNKQATL